MIEVLENGAILNDEYGYRYYELWQSAYNDIEGIEEFLFKIKMMIPTQEKYSELDGEEISVLRKKIAFWMDEISALADHAVTCLHNNGLEKSNTK